MVLHSFRHHQIAADKAIADELKDNDRCLVKMFCGTGKSLLMREMKVVKNKKLVVYVFPSLALIDQFSRDYLKGCHFIKVSSEMESTTDIEVIRDFINEERNKIVLVTYQSFETLLSSLDGNIIDVCVFDEAHHVVGEKIKDLIFHFENYSDSDSDNFSDDSSYIGSVQGSIAQCKFAKKMVFLTATPVNRNGIVMESEEDEIGHCGNCCYSYSYYDGLNDYDETGKPMLNPFEVRIEFYTEKGNFSIYESIIRAAFVTGNNRVMTFHSTVNGDDETSVLNFVDQSLIYESFLKVKEEFDDRYTSIIFVGISAEMKMEERRRILNAFENCKKNQIFILSSCETIGEGVDTKKAGMCVFVEPRTSTTKIIQNIGRIVRRRETGEEGDSTILIPCWVDANKYLQCSSPEERDQRIREDMNGDFNQILNVMAAIKQESDELFNEILGLKPEFSQRQVESELRKQNFQPEEKGKELKEFIEEFFGESVEGEDEEEIFENASEKFGVSFEIFSQGENPVQNIGDGEKIVRLLYDQEREVFHLIKENRKKISKKKIGEFKKSKITVIGDIKALWGIVEGIDLENKIGSCVLNFQIVKLNPLEKAKEIAEWVRINGRLPKYSNPKYSKNEERKKESQYANYLSTKRSELRNNKKNKIIDFLNENIENWSFVSNPIHHDMVKKVEDIVKWIKENGKIPEPNYEKNVEDYYSRELHKLRVKYYIKGRGKINKSIAKILDEIDGWKEEIFVEKDKFIQLKYLEEIINWYNVKGFPRSKWEILFRNHIFGNFKIRNNISEDEKKEIYYFEKLRNFYKECYTEVEVKLKHEIYNWKEQVEKMIKNHEEYMQRINIIH